MGVVTGGLGGVCVGWRRHGERWDGMIMPNTQREICQEMRRHLDILEV